MALGCTRLDNETWRQAVERYASKHGLQKECLEIFDTEIRTGIEPREAAWDALCEWDCLDYIPDNKAKELKNQTRSSGDAQT